MKSRWVFTQPELERPGTCKAQDCFVAIIEDQPLGVLVCRNGQVTNMWEDGTIGIPPSVSELANDIESLFNPYTNIVAEDWRNVEVDDNGNFIKFI
jgi:hypothetical protein